MGGTVTMVDPDGGTYDVADKDVSVKIAQGYHVQTPAEEGARVKAAVNEEAYGGASGAFQAGALNIISGATGGLSDLALRAAVPGAAEGLRQLESQHPYLSAGGQAVGTALGALATGGSNLATGIGERAAARLGGGALAKIGGAAVAGGIEGAVVGAGQGVHELALGEDPITLERAASVLGSNVLLGAATGGAVGGLAKGAEVGLSKAARSLNAIADRSAAIGGVPEDLARLDRKGLRAAEKAELDAIEAARVPERAQVAEELSAFRKELKDQKIWLATKGSEDAEVRALTKRTFKADKALDNLLDDPKALAENPKAALRHLRIQEAAFEETIKKTDDLRAIFAAEREKAATGAASAAPMSWREFTTGKMGAYMKSEGGHTGAMKRLGREWEQYKASGAATPAAKTAPSFAREQALDAFPAMLEKNRALQARITELAATPASARLTAIRDAADVLAEGGGKKSIAEQMLGGSAFGAVAGVAHAIPLVGPMLAPLAGAKAAQLVGEKVFGKLGKAVTASQARRMRAVGALLDTTGKVVAKSPTPVATKVLASVRFADHGDDEKPAPPPKGKKPPKQYGPRIEEAFHARAGEIRSQVVSDPMTGKAVMRPDARAEIAKRLAPIAAHSPLLADLIETIQARRIEYLADKLRELAPKPDYGSVSFGPDRWRPSDMAIRTWARHVAAVEDPDATFERVAAGKSTPEDAEAMKTVYPEQYADFQREVVMGLSQLDKPLPFARRLSLSIFTGLPIDPSMNPQILAGLQGAFASEPGTDGGTHAPVPQPQFGSVGSVKSIDKATPAQARAG